MDKRKFAALLTAVALAFVGTLCARLPLAAAQQEAETDAYAQEVVQLVNEARAQAGLEALELDEELCAAARVRVEEIKRSFSHTRPNGKSSFSVLKELDIDYLACAENIARGSQTPQAVMSGWMFSPGHRRNILNARFTALGVACSAGAGGTLHWVQIFTTGREALAAR